MRAFLTAACAAVPACLHHQTTTGLPVGLQIVGPPGGDALLLAEAAAFERAHSYWRQVPRVVNGQAG